MAASSAIRFPRGLVKINGVIVKGWLDWEVDTNAFYMADVFRVRLPLSDMIAPYDVNWLTQQNTLTVEIFAGFPANPERFDQSELTSLIYGHVDEVMVEMHDTIIELSGRDLTATLIDAQTTEEFRNQTSSQIATTLAQRHGLTPVVTATNTLTGTYYNDDYTRQNFQRSEWDLLTSLADEEGMAVYVQGQSLHFEPKPQPTSTPYMLKWEPNKFDGMALTFSRNLTLAKDIIVTYKSKHQDGHTFSQTVRASHSKNIGFGSSSLPAGTPQVYQRVRANKSPQELLKLAQKELESLSRHELKLAADLPADNVLSLTQMIQVVGTSTIFDTLYYPDSILRKMNVHDGYVMSINAKNHSPESELLV